MKKFTNKSETNHTSHRRYSEVETGVQFVHRNQRNILKKSCFQTPFG